jgi:hypothetical protein
MEWRMAFNDELAARVRGHLTSKPGVQEKRMFGGLCFLLHGNLLVCVWKDALIVRLTPEEYEEVLLEPHVRKFDVTGRPMKGWVMVDLEGLEEDDELKFWIERAMDFVRTLPKK